MQDSSQPHISPQGGAVLSYAPVLVFASAVFGALCGFLITLIPDKIFKNEV